MIGGGCQKMENETWPVYYNVKKVDKDYSWEIKVLAKDDVTLEEILKNLTNIGD